MMCMCIYIYINIHQPYLTDLTNLTDLFQHRPLLPILSSRPSSSATPQRILTFDRKEIFKFVPKSWNHFSNFFGKKVALRIRTSYFDPRNHPNFETTKLCCQHSKRAHAKHPSLTRASHHQLPPAYDPEICCGDALNIKQGMNVVV